MKNSIEGIIYDLDGTIIDTSALHQSGWIHAATVYGVKLTAEMLQKQSGMPDADAAKMMLGNIGSSADVELQEFIKAKQNYVLKNIGNAKVFPDFLETHIDLIRNDAKVWICTSAAKFFMDAVFENIPELVAFKDKVVYREMCAKGKPDPEPLLLTAKKMDVVIWQCLYIGDAYNDYLAALRAGCLFRYFLRGTRDEKIPLVKAIFNHKEILNIL